MIAAGVASEADASASGGRVCFGLCVDRVANRLSSALASPNSRESAGFDSLSGSSRLRCTGPFSHWAFTTFSRGEGRGRDRASVEGAACPSADIGLGRCGLSMTLFRRCVEPRTRACSDVVGIVSRVGHNARKLPGAEAKNRQSTVTEPRRIGLLRWCNDYFILQRPTTHAAHQTGGYAITMRGVDNKNGSCRSRVQAVSPRGTLAQVSNDIGERAHVPLLTNASIHELRLARAVYSLGGLRPTRCCVVAQTLSQRT